MKIHSVIGGGGVRLHVREWGKNSAPAILLIHGWSQNHLCWQKQYESELAEEFRLVAFDLRGHGMSDAPLAQENYTEPQLWADDIAAIIKQLGLDRPVLVGWSYAGFIVCDYIRAYGQNAIAGINFVGAAVTLDSSAFGVLIGPGSSIMCPARPPMIYLPTFKQSETSCVHALLGRCRVTITRRLSAGTWPFRLGYGLHSLRE